METSARRIVARSSATMGTAWKTSCGISGGIPTRIEGDHRRMPADRGGPASGSRREAAGRRRRAAAPLALREGREGVGPPCHILGLMGVDPRAAHERVSYEWDGEAGALLLSGEAIADHCNVLPSKACKVHLLAVDSSHREFEVCCVRCGCCKLHISWRQLNWMLLQCLHLPVDSTTSSMCSPASATPSATNFNPEHQEK